MLLNGLILQPPSEELTEGNKSYGKMILSKYFKHIHYCNSQLECCNFHISTAVNNGNYFSAFKKTVHYLKHILKKKKKHLAPSCKYPNGCTQTYVCDWRSYGA